MLIGGLVTVAVIVTPLVASAQSWWAFTRNPKDRLYGMSEAKPAKPFTATPAFVQLADYYYVAVAYGLEDEAKRSGVTLRPILSAGGYDQLANQIKQVEDLIVSDVDVILLFAISEEGTAAVVDRAVAKGKKVVTFVSGTKSKNVYANVLEDFRGAGVRQAEYQCRRLKGRKSPRVAMLNGPAGAQWAIEMHDGFVTTLKKTCPEVRIVDEKWSPLTASHALTITEDFLTRYPDLDGLYSVYDVMARGAAPAVEKFRQRHPNFVFTTQGFSPWGRDELTKGQLDMTPAALPVLIGRWAIQATIHAMNGDPGPTNANPLRTPTPEVTKDTIRTFNTEFSFYPDSYKITQ
jgi:ABC-type sugar transport system substrate-binding protein